MPATTTRLSHSVLNCLTPPQLQALPLLLAGLTVASVAQNLNLNPTTLHQWLNHDPAFNDELNRARKNIYDSALDRLRSLLTTALDKLQELLAHPNPRIALAAAKSIIAYSLTKSANPHTPLSTSPSSHPPISLPPPKHDPADDLPQLPPAPVQQWMWDKFDKQFAAMVEQVRQIETTRPQPKPGQPNPPADTTFGQSHP